MFENIELKATLLNSNSEGFIIRKKNFFDFFRKNTSTLKINNKYVLVGVPSNRKLELYVLKHFQEPIKTNHLYKAAFNEDELHISIHNYNDCFKLVQKLLNRK